MNANGGRRMRAWWALALLSCAACDARMAAGERGGTGTADAKLRQTSGAWTAPAPFFAGQRATDACPAQHRPAAALRGDGALVAVWYESPDSGLARLLWSERPAGAGAWSEPRPVAADAAGYWDDGPAALVSMPDGSLVLAWRAGAPDPEAARPVRMASLGAQGGAWRATAAPAVVAPPLAGPALAPAPDGLHAVWQDDTGIRHSLRAADGRWSPPEALRRPGRRVSVETSAGPTPMATSGFGPVVAAAPDGSVLVAWWDDERTLSPSGGNEFDLIVRQYDPRERAWSAPEAVLGARSNQTHAALAAGRSGFVLVSTDQAERLQARQRPFGGGAWSPVVAVPDRAGARGAEPALVRSADGRLLLTWRSFLEEGDNRLGAAVSENGARFAGLFSSPPLAADDLVHGGVFNSRGAPVVWFNDPAVRASCGAVAWSEMSGPYSGKPSPERTQP